MTKRQEMDFFKLNEVEYDIFVNYFKNPYDALAINYATIGKAYKCTRQCIAIKVRHLKMKLKLGNKIIFYDKFNEDKVSQSNYKEKYKEFLSNVYAGCDYDKALISILDIDRKLYFKLKNQKISTISDFISFMSEGLETQGKEFKIKGVVDTKLERLKEIFYELIRLKFSPKKCQEEDFKDIRG